VPTPEPASLSAEFEALYRAHFPFVWRSLRRFGVPTANLDDATQDVFVIVHRRFGIWERDRSVRAWLYGVTRRVAAAHRRKLERHQRRLDALPRPAAHTQIEPQIGARHRLERIAAEIDRLEPGRRQVYLLIEVEGLSAPEVAQALGCKLNTVYSRLRRARAQLEVTLGDADAGDRPPTNRQRAGETRS